MATATWFSKSSFVAIFSFLALEFSSPVSAKWVKSTIDTTADWTFITRFCFLSEDGRFDYVYKYPVSYGIQSLLLYYDEPGQWESVYKSSKNCSQRASILSKSNNQIIDLTNQLTGSRNAGCMVYNDTDSGQMYYNCTDKVSFRARRARWWYIVLARCEASQGGGVGLKLDYEMHMMNGPANDYLHHELSADEFYILPVDIAFLLAFFVLLIFSIICAIKLFDRQMFHTTYKMYIVSLSLWMFGLFLQCIAWGRYSESGWEEGPTEVTGRLFQAASTAVFILMLLLLAKGYTITRGRLTQLSTVRLTIFFCLYIIVNVTLFIWEGMFFDEGLVLYFYESPPGYGLIAMRLIGWLWFLYAFIFTMKHHSHKAKFYIPFFIFYTLWFFAGPIVILCAILSIAKWSRRKTVNGVEQFVAFLGYLFFLILTRPSAANSNFPYHLRVSQVRFSDEEDDPNQTYGISEESQRHLDSMFTVSGRGGSSNMSSNPPSYSASNGGHVNNGYMKTENGYNPTLDSTFITQHRDSSAHNGTRLPPIQAHRPAIPPSYSNGSSPPGYDIVMPTPSSQGQQEVTPPSQGNGQALPPIGNARLPPINSGLLPPITASVAAPSAPAPTENE